MKKRIIETEITKAIHTIKCGQNLRITGNTRLMNTLAKFRKETCNPKKPRKTEKAIIINNNGETVIDKKGDKNSVTWNSNEILKAFTENNELHIEHNHPLYENPKLPVFLSGDDIIRIRDKIGQYKNGIYTGDYVFKSITCEGANGTRMTLIRGDNYKDTDNTKLQEIIADYQKELITEYTKHDTTNTEYTITRKFYEIRDKYFQEHPDIQTITDEQVTKFYQQAENQIYKNFNPYPIFQKYKKQFRKINLNLTWSKNL